MPPATPPNAPPIKAPAPRDPPVKALIPRPAPAPMAAPDNAPCCVRDIFVQAEKHRTIIIKVERSAFCMVVSLFLPVGFDHFMPNDFKYVPVHFVRIIFIIIIDLVGELCPAHIFKCANPSLDK